METERLAQQCQEIAAALPTVFPAYTILDRDFSLALSFADSSPDIASPFPVL